MLISPSKENMGFYSVSPPGVFQWSQHNGYSNGLFAVKSNATLEDVGVAVHLTEAAMASGPCLSDVLHEPVIARPVDIQIDDGYFETTRIDQSSDK